MKNELETKNFIPQQYLKKKNRNNYIKKLNNILEKIVINIHDNKKTLNVLDDKFEFNFKKEELKKFDKFKIIAIIGMGGSILGAESIYYFLQEKIKKKFYFFNDLNPKKISLFKKKVNLSKVLFIVISKSGTTVETLANFLCLNILKKSSKNILVISEKNNNLLYSITKRLNLNYIEHNENIGGRYSVLSEVGSVPAYLMGCNIKKLRSNILSFLKGNKKLFLKESVLKLASLFKSKKIKNIIFLNYAPELEKFLFWCQQLLAESLGKKGNGFLPLISNAPKDHHSLLQLYLDGPKDKLFCIFSLDKTSKEKISSNDNLIKSYFLNKKKLDEIKEAQRKALTKTLKEKKIPFREFKVRKNNESVLGELFAYFMLETIILGELANINPYDQPAVEQVKILTKKLLK